jgi:serine/threonine-protein kinase
VGHTPFTAATLSELAIKVATTEPVPIKTLRPDAPSALCAIIDRAIKRDRNQRWPDVPSLMQQLTPFAQAASFRAHMTFQDMTAPRLAQPQRRVAPPPSLPEPTWAETAAVNGTLPRTQSEAFAVATPSPRASHFPSDSLLGRELAGEDKPKNNPLPVWLAAAALLAVAVIAAFLLLSDPKPTHPIETSSSAASAPTSAASAPLPSIPPPVKSQPGLQIEQLAPAPAVEAQPVQPLQAYPSGLLEPSTQPDSSRSSEQQNKTGRRRRGALQRTAAEPAREADAPRARPEVTTPPARQKNAGDLLGF